MTAPIRVLFVSRRNTARSLLAQACLQHQDAERFRAFSCGKREDLGVRPHPAVLEALRTARIPVDGLAPKGWDWFSGPQGKRVDFVIHLAPEVIQDAPVWPGQPVTAMWSFTDVLAPGTTAPDMLEHAMLQQLIALRRRIELFTSLPLASGERSVLREDIRGIDRN